MEPTQKRCDRVMQIAYPPVRLDGMGGDIMVNTAQFGVRAAVLAGASAMSLNAHAQESADSRALTIEDEIIVIGDVPVRNRTLEVNPELSYDVQFFQRFEPLSVGDALKRVPGVAFTADVGEFDDPQLRGLGNGFTQILINGEPVAAAGGESGTQRTVFVDRIPAELVEKIEIIRSPSADIDSQGVGGTINIVLKEGESLPAGGFVRGGGAYFLPNVDGGDGEFRGLGGAGYSGKAMGGKLTYTGVFNVQSRYNAKFLVQEEFSADRGDVETARGLLAFDGENSVIGDGEVRQVQNDIRRNLDISFNGDIGYRFDGGHQIQVRGFYIRTDREEREDTLEFEDAPDNLVEVAAQDTEFDQDSYGGQVRYEHRLTSNIDIIARAGVSFFDNTQTQLDLVGDPGDFEAIAPTEQEFRDGLSVADLPLERDETELLETEDLDAFYALESEARLNGVADALGFESFSLKGGFQGRIRDRDNRFVIAGFDDGVQEDFEPGDTGGEFEIRETRFDGFLLSEMNVNPALSVELGVRIEYTDTSLDGFADGEPQSTDQTNTQVNPSAHLRYAATNWATLRASYARTVRRPEFNQRIPFLLSETPDDEDQTLGNPDLDFETSNGVDAGVEFNLPGNGIMGFNAFYRSVNDLIQLSAFRDNELGGNDFTFRNVGDADIYGFEFDLSTSLQGLGALLNTRFLDNTGIFANYTYLDSERRDEFSGRDVEINDQPTFVANVGLTQSIPSYGVAFGFSYQRQGEAFSYQLDEIQRTTYTANLEAFVEKRFGENFALRLTGNNILDAESFQEEENFDGLVSEGELDGFEIEREEAQQRILLVLRAAF